LKLAQAVAELNPLDDLRQPVPAVEVAPFALRGDHQLERHGEAGLNLAAINRRSRKASCAAWRQNVHSHAMLLRLLCCTAVSQIPAHCGGDRLFDVPCPNWPFGAASLTIAACLAGQLQVRELNHDFVSRPLDIALLRHHYI
jgi:hypothetical protein